MSALRNQVRRAFYLDSVALMRLSAAIAARAGVEDAVLMIGTESNRDIMAGAGLLTDDGRAAGANDLVIAVRAVDEPSLSAALAAAADGLDDARSTSIDVAQAQPGSLELAVRALPECNLAFISTPGAFAAREARQALGLGLNVLLFSDNVALADEVALKRQALDAGLLMMGPDCGTAYIGGRPLAFANRVPSGDISVIAASGTGLQEFAVRAAEAGNGLRHGIGVGGRDLSDDVGGLSTLAALDLLDADPGTARIVVIGKPPGPATAARVFARLTRCAKPVTVCLFGVDPVDVPSPLVAASTLAEAAALCSGIEPAVTLERIAARADEITSGLRPERRWLHGLFCGGTLCTEAQQVLGKTGIIVSSNLASSATSAASNAAHRCLDLGADEFTLGRPHPMIDPAPREERLMQALADPSIAVVLLDLVLGLGAHADPAAHVCAALTSAPASRPCIIASVCGTDQDPQNARRQSAALADAGVELAASNAEAAALAGAVIARLSAG